MSFEYLIEHSHHVSSSRPRMSLGDRAAQFAPFAALTGYDDIVNETARITDVRKNMTDDERNILDRTFQKMLELDRPRVTVRYFEPDKSKSGGKYHIYTGDFRFFDAGNMIIKFTDGMSLRTDMICMLSLDGQYNMTGHGCF